MAGSPAPRMLLHPAGTGSKPVLKYPLPSPTKGCLKLTSTSHLCQLGLGESRCWDTFRSIKGLLRCNPYERGKEEAGLGKGSGQVVDLTKSLSVPQGALEHLSRGLCGAEMVRTFSHSPAQSWARPTPRRLVAELRSWEKSERVNSGGCQLDTPLTGGPWAPSWRRNVSSATLQLAFHSNIQK